MGINWIDVSKGNFGKLADDVHLEIERADGDAVSAILSVGDRKIRIKSANTYSEKIVLSEPEGPKKVTKWQVDCRVGDGNVSSLVDSKKIADDMVAEFTEAGFEPEVKTIEVIE